MHRTTIMLPPELKARAERQAREAGISLAELIRRSLRERLERQGGEIREDPLFTDDVVYSGEAPGDTVSDHDRYLYDEPG